MRNLTTEHISNSILVTLTSNTKAKNKNYLLRQAALGDIQAKILTMR
jgi:hypothetical protein